jgi:hypothetical protein
MTHKAMALVFNPYSNRTAMAEVIYGRINCDFANVVGLMFCQQCC